MDKQLTPIQKAIEWCNKQLAPLEEEDRVWQEKSRHTDIIDYPLVPEQIEAMVALQRTRTYLKSLLPEEKQFAENVFNSGVKLGKVVDERLGGQRVSSETTPSFTNFYKQYEDEK